MPGHSDHIRSLHTTISCCSSLLLYTSCTTALYIHFQTSGAGWTRDVFGQFTGNIVAQDHTKSAVRINVSRGVLLIYIKTTGEPIYHCSERWNLGLSNY